MRFRAWDGKKMIYNVVPWQWNFVIDRGMWQCLTNEADGSVLMRVRACPFKELMQFTGLLDAKGKEIWEGDIVKIPDKSDPIWQIIWHNKGFCLGRKRKEGLDWGANESGFVCYERTWAEIEVIGNIYERGEL